MIEAQICRDLHPDSGLLLDDGYQHLPLHKDVTILLDPPDLENVVQPSGPYREPRSTDGCARRGRAGQVQAERTDGLAPHGEGRDARDRDAGQRRARDRRGRSGSLTRSRHYGFRARTRSCCRTTTN